MLGTTASPSQAAEGRGHREAPAGKAERSAKPRPGGEASAGAGGSEKTSLHIFRATTVCRGHRQGRLPASTTAQGRVTRRAGRSTPQDVGGGRLAHATPLGSATDCRRVGKGDAPRREPPRAWVHPASAACHPRTREGEKDAGSRGGRARGGRRAGGRR